MKKLVNNQEAEPFNEGQLTRKKTRPITYEKKMIKAHCGYPKNF